MTWIRVASLVLLLGLPCSQSVGQETAGQNPQPQTQQGLFRTENVRLNRILSSYTLGKVTVAENLAVAGIQSMEPAKVSDKYISLDEALKQKLLIIREVSDQGSVPELQVISLADTPIFLPFGSIITGGKQDRMLRQDVLLQARESMNVSVYCVERGRWRRTGPQGIFNASSQVAPQSLKMLGRAQQPQGAIWGKVSERNKTLGNSSTSENLQDNVRTEAFKKLAMQLDPVKTGMVRQERVHGTMVILDGKVLGTEIFAGEAYFRKVWPELFNSYVVDAASRKETVKTDADKAQDLAKAFLSSMYSAKVTETREKDLIRFTLESGTCLGHALVEGKKGHLVYLGIFERPKEVDLGTNRQQMNQMRQQRAPQTYPAGQRHSRLGQIDNTGRSGAVSSASQITADNVAESAGNNRRKWTVFVKGDKQDIEAIKCVQYTLHPTFPNPVRLVCDRGQPNRAFELTATGWGTFNIGIRLFMKDGSHKELQHRLKF